MAQKKYSTTKKEFLAIFEALREFRFIVWGTTALSTRTIVRCRIYLNENCEAIAPWPMARWGIEIDTFNVHAKYFEGKRNVVADFLSRIEGDALTIDVLDKCDSILSTEKETMMVMTCSAKEKLKLNYEVNFSR